MYCSEIKKEVSLMKKTRCKNWQKFTGLLLALTIIMTVLLVPVYAADICPFPMFQRLLAPPEKDIAYISALMYSAQGWTYDLS